MQKAIYSIAVLTPAILVIGNLNQIGRAEGISQNVRIPQLQRLLQAAVCRNDWNEALQVINPFIGNPDITSDYRQELVRFRYQLENWRAAKSRFIHRSDCLGVTGDLSQTSQENRRSPSPTSQLPSEENLQLLYTALHSAICRNDWDQALAVIQPLIGSPDISPNYRQQLVRFRYQLETWHASQAQVVAIPTCRAIAAIPAPEQLNSIAWS